MGSYKSHRLESCSTGLHEKAHFWERHDQVSREKSRNEDPQASNSLAPKLAAQSLTGCLKSREIGILDLAHAHLCAIGRMNMVA